MAARVFVWLGGSLFVASLAYCAYSFVVPWSTELPPSLHETDRWIAIAQDFALLTVFALHHSLFARAPLKRAIARWIPAELVRSTYVWIASALLIVVCAWWQPIGGAVYDNREVWMRIGHALVQLTGVVLIARAVATIDPLELAGIRPALGSGSLQASGPYRLVRHPLYLGWVLVVFGTALMTGDRLAFAIITTLYLVVAVPWEERSLRAAFGDEYARYTRAVRWRIVPFIY